MKRDAELVDEGGVVDETTADYGFVACEKGTGVNDEAKRDALQNRASTMDSTRHRMEFASAFEPHTSVSLYQNAVRTLRCSQKICLEGFERSFRAASGSISFSNEVEADMVVIIQKGLELTEFGTLRTVTSLILMRHLWRACTKSDLIRVEGSERPMSGSNFCRRMEISWINTTAVELVIADA